MLSLLFAIHKAGKLNLYVYSIPKLSPKISSNFGCGFEKKMAYTTA